MRRAVGLRAGPHRIFARARRASLGQAGVALDRPRRAQGSPKIRGQNGVRTLLLVDGIRIDTSIWRSGNVEYWNTVDPGDPRDGAGRDFGFAAGLSAKTFGPLALLGSRASSFWAVA